jgi:hypothetical protein
MVRTAGWKLGPSWSLYYLLLPHPTDMQSQSEPKYATKQTRLPHAIKTAEHEAVNGSRR